MQFFTGLVQFLKSLSKYIASRYIFIDDVVSIWRFLECRCVLREIQISLRSLQQFTRFRFFVETSLWCGVVHALNTVSESGFRRQNPFRQGENFKSVVVICGLELYGNDCYSFLQLESLVYENNVKTLMSFGGLRMIAPPYDGSSTDFHVTKNVVMVQHLSLFVKQEACCFEVLMNFAVERFLQFHSYVSAHMRLMEQRSPSIDVMEVMLLSCLTKINSFSSKWLDLHVIIGSQSCVSRHEKIWSRLATLIYEAVCIFARKGLCFTQELFGWLKCFLFVVIGCSITEIHSDVVFALCATPELLMTLSLLQPLFHWFKSSKRSASVNVLEFGSCLQKLQQLMSCGCPRHVVTLTGLLFKLLASRVQILYISFGDPLIFLMHMMPRVVIVGCDRVQIFAAEVFVLNATLTQSLPQLCLQGHSIDIDIFGLTFSCPR